MQLLTASIRVLLASLRVRQALVKVRTASLREWRASARVRFASTSALIVWLASVGLTAANDDMRNTLAVPGRSSATPTVVADGSLVVVAFGATTATGTTDVYSAVSRDGAKTFSAPVRVNNLEGDARLNGEQPPRVALVRRQNALDEIVVVWTTKGKTGTRLVSARSLDGGRSYAPSATVRESDAPGNRGWQNVVAGNTGDIYAIWLDHREMADHAMGNAPSHDHAGTRKMDGVAMAQQSKLYIGSIDGSVRPHPVTGGVCYCCKTAIAVATNGMIAAAWRHVYPGNFRDIAFAESADGGRTFTSPVRVSEDKWMLEGCPDDGPAMAIDARNVVHIAWPTLISDDKTGEPTIAIFYARSSDGRTFTSRVRMPTEGVAHHPQVVIDRHGEPIVAWDESGSGVRRVVVSPATSPKRSGISETAVYPTLALAGEHVVAAWTASRPSGAIIETTWLPPSR